MVVLIHFEIMQLFMLSLFKFIILYVLLFYVCCKIEKIYI